MRHHLVIFHTGPTIVERIAEKMREAGLRVRTVGTERVYLDVECEGDWLNARIFVLSKLREKHGTTFGLA